MLEPEEDDNGSCPARFVDSGSSRSPWRYLMACSLTAWLCPQLKV
jgi:hypothetical protein